MKILYALSGEGMGHSTRSSTVIDFLVKEGHEIIILTNGAATKFLSDKYSKSKGVKQVYGIHGLYMEYTERKLSLTGTALINLKTIVHAPITFFKVLGIVRKFNPDVIISDYEILSTILGRLLGKPVLGIDNSASLVLTKFNIDKKYKSGYLETWLVTFFKVFLCNEHLITTFFDPVPKNNKITLVPPIVRESIQTIKPSIGNHVLVYQTNKNNHGLIDILSEIKTEKFIVYGIVPKKSHSNIVAKQFNEKEFFVDLGSAKAVIVNGGYSLIGESIYLGKPIFSIPIIGQFEQSLNGYFIEKKGYGTCSLDPNTGVLNIFLDNLAKYQSNLKLHKQQGNNKLFSLVNKFLKKYEKVKKG